MAAIEESMITTAHVSSEEISVHCFVVYGCGAGKYSGKPPIYFK